MSVRFCAMSRPLAIALLTAIAAAAAPADRASRTIDDVAWIAGCWTLHAGTRITEEQWMKPRGGTMMGMSRTVRDGRTLEYEALRIFTADDGTLVYGSTPSGQRYTEFRATHASRDSAAFANPAHDFPQRIVYRRIRSDSLVAAIQGTVSGATRSIEFRLARTPCT